MKNLAASNLRSADLQIEFRGPLHLVGFVSNSNVLKAEEDYKHAGCWKYWRDRLA